MAENKGKEAEAKIREWLNRPEADYDFNRIPDQTSGFYGSKNICDFDVYHHPLHFYIESKSTFEDRFDFALITDYQHDEMLKKSAIRGVYSLVSVLFISHKRCFMLDIRDVDSLMKQGIKSLNIKKISTWPLKYCEIRTIPSRKALLDYEGELEEYIPRRDNE